jgi:hypothetical protein
MTLSQATPRKRHILMTVLLALLCIAVVLLANAAWACPGCTDALGGDEPSGLARGFFWSILLMLSMPLLLMGAVTWKVIRSSQRARIDHVSTQRSL